RPLGGRGAPRYGHPPAGIRRDVTLHEGDAVRIVGRVLVVGTYRADGREANRVCRRFDIETAPVLDPEHRTCDDGHEHCEIESQKPPSTCLIQVRPQAPGLRMEPPLPEI